MPSVLAQLSYGYSRKKSSLLNKVCENQYIAMDRKIDEELMKSMRKISSIEYIIKNRALGTVFYI